MKAWKSILFAAIFISVFLFGCASVSVYETSIGGKMIKISAGKFMMGSEKSENGHYPDEFFHEVTISKDFLIGETEVTQAQWEEVMGADPSHFTGCSDCPVEMVSWYDAIRFTNRLSEIEGFNKCYVGQGQDYSWDFSCNGYRLPTEAEWEFAARAGTTTVYSLGDCVTTDQVNFNGSSPLPDCPAGQYRGKTIPVASLAANKFGLYDIHGNVWEWVWDRWDKDYPRDSQTDPKGPNVGDRRINRGGSYHHNGRLARSAVRDFNTDTDKIPQLGFRIARSL